MPDFELAPVALEPKAQAVNTYIQPMRAEDSPLMGFARGLSTLDNGLENFVRVRDAQQQKLDETNAQAAFIKNNRQGYDEAVNQGLIPAGASPHFVASYKLAQGAAMGNDLQSQFAAAYDGWDGKNSADPQAYSNFVAGFVKNNVKTNDPYILRGLLPAVSQLTEEGQQRFTADQHRQAVMTNLDVATALTNQAIDGQHNVGLGSASGTNYEAIGGNLDRIFTNATAAGLDTASRKQLSISILQAIGDKAIEHRDPGLLALFDRKVPGQDYTWGDTSEGQGLKKEYTLKLEEMGRAAIAKDAEEQKKIDAELKRQAQLTVVEALAKDPSAPIPEAQLQALQKYDPEARVHAIEWRKTLSEGDSVSDPKALLHVAEDTMNGGGMDAVINGLNFGVFKNAKDLTEARAFAESVTKDGQGNNILKDPATESVLNTIYQRTLSADDLQNFNPFAPKGLSDNGLQKQYEFKRQMILWSSQNPQATQLDRLDAIKKIGDGVLSGIPEQGASKPTNPDGTANLKPSEGGGPTVTPAVQPPAIQQPAPTKAPVVAPPPVAPAQKHSELPSGFSPASYMENDPMTSEGHVSLTVQDLRKAIDDAYTAGPTKGTFNLAAIKDDPQAAHILDFVSQHESGGNYNAYFGHGSSADPLDHLTVDQVMALQKSRTDAGSPSSAIGRYQIIRGTLKSLKAQMGLKGDEKFTPLLQDQLAVQLMKDSGLDDFKSGKLAPKDFANRLARVWASLPNIETGSSFYAGDGLNKSLVKPADVLTTLDNSKTTTA